MRGVPYEQDEKDEALAIYAEHGPAEAAHRTGIPYNTIRQWSRVAGLTAPNYKNAATPEHRKRLSILQAETAERLYVEANQLLDKMYEPTVEKKAISYAALGTYEVAEIERDSPTFSEQKNIMTSAAIAIDKAQLLAGEATDRSERIDPVKARERVEKAFDELAARRTA